MTWQAFGASVQGTSHIRAGLPCQDACGWRTIPNGVICAVADGLGSAIKADSGAREAVAVVLRYLTTANSAINQDATIATAKQILRDAFHASREALMLTAGINPVRDYATTLSVAWICESWTVVGQIGDGAIVGRWADGQLATLSMPQRGEFANQTNPLTAPDALTHLDIGGWDCPVDKLALLTDGLQGLALNFLTGNPHPPFFAPFFDAVRTPIDSDVLSADLSSFLHSQRICERTDDDKTLLVAGRTDTHSAC